MRLKRRARLTLLLFEPLSAFKSLPFFLYNGVLYGQGPKACLCDPSKGVNRPTSIRRVTPDDSSEKLGGIHTTFSVGVSARCDDSSGVDLLSALPVFVASRGGIAFGDDVFGFSVDWPSSGELVVCLELMMDIAIKELLQIRLVTRHRKFDVEHVYSLNRLCLTSD